MSSTKRKRKPRADSSKRSASESMTIPSPASAGPELTRNFGVCVPCKKAKTRCHFVSGASICNRCKKKGLNTECIIEPPNPRTHGTRSNSIKTLLPSKPVNQPTVNNIPGSSTQRKRSNSDASDSESIQTNHPAKHPRLASQRSRQTALNSIVEEDESLADTLVQDHHVGYDDFDITERNHTRLIEKTQFVDALHVADDKNEGSGGSDMDMEESVEEIDIDISDGCGSSEDEDEDLSLSQPIQRRLPSHSRTMKSIKSQSHGSTKSRRTKHEPDSMEDTYDPSTCPFDISGVVCRPDGANAPITVPSTTTLDRLRIAVAEKLGRFPGLVVLQYRLSNDNAKIGAISIQTNEELLLFKERLRKIIVPPRLANGKVSTRTPKPVLVYFEDASMETKETPISSSGSKKNTLAAPAASRQTTPFVPNGQTELQARKMRIISELQSKWRCAKHSKDHDIYCYSNDGNVCLTLTHGNLTFWALEIIEGTATIEEKPATLRLHTARPSSRASTPHPPQADQMPVGFPGPYTMAPGMYGYQGPMSMPMWGYPGGMPVPPPLAAQYFGQPPMMNSTAAGVSQTMSESASGNRDAITSSSNTTSVIIPDIVAWFAYLDQHEERNKDGIVFAPYGVELKRKGFLRITQLTLEFIQLKDLQDWLGIEVGTAILIMQYAKEDIEALKSRKWVFPG